MERAKFDWLAELAGASALGFATGFSALKAAPSLALPAPAAMVAGGFACFGLGLAAMRAVRPAPRQLLLAEFGFYPDDGDELMLDTPWQEPLLLEDRFEEAEPLPLEEKFEEIEVLLLEDALPSPPVNSRVVQLFASPPLPTPGQLKDRIDRHLAGASRIAQPPMPLPQADASQALYAALDELRRSLR